MSKTAEKSNSYPPWAPRIWSGFTPHQHWRLLAENKFSIHPVRYPMTAAVSVCTLFNAGLSLVQKLAMGKRIAETNLDSPPVFIIGHWRSGTTLLHELLSLDQNSAFASNFDAFVPLHFLISEPLVKPLLKLLLPGKRPMDNMAMHPDLPQEDEFALMILGVASQYRRMGFPHTSNDYYRSLDSQNLTADELEYFKKQLIYFFKALTLKYDNQRLVLKSPPHTGRISSLLEMFPEAKFIHISRHPYDIVPSTMRLWKVADYVHAYQNPKYSDDELMDYIHCCKEVMYGAYTRDRSLLAENQLAEIRFDDLTSDPVSTVEQIYQQLQLGDFGQVVDAVRQNFADRKGHRKNVHHVDSFVERIDSEWSDYMQLFGYQSQGQCGEQTYVA